MAKGLKVIFILSLGIQLISGRLCAQELEIDTSFTVEYESAEVEYPTMVNDTSRLNKLSEKAGFKLVDILVEEAREKHVWGGLNIWLLKRKRSGDTLDVKFHFTHGCTYSFLGEIEILGSDTMNLVCTGYGDRCYCTCPFNVTYRIVLENTEPTFFRLSGQPLHKLNDVRNRAVIENASDTSGIKSTSVYMGDAILFKHFHNGKEHSTTSVFYQDGRKVYTRTW